ncbi:MAG: hypothetical protein WDN69_33505 [Aliidongia sp.]
MLSSFPAAAIGRFQAATIAIGDETKPAAVLAEKLSVTLADMDAQVTDSSLGNGQSWSRYVSDIDAAVNTTEQANRTVRGDDAEAEALRNRSVETPQLLSADRRVERDLAGHLRQQRTIGDDHDVVGLAHDAAGHHPAGPEGRGAGGRQSWSTPMPNSAATLSSRPPLRCCRSCCCSCCLLRRSCSSRGGRAG